MNHVEQIFYNRLEGFDGLEALVKARIFPVEAPQDILRPFVTYQVISRARVKKLTGPAYISQSRFQVDCYSISYIGAREIASQVRLALDGWRDTTADLSIKGSSLLNDSDFDVTETDPKLYRVLLEFLITHEESAA